jgi:phage FluMu protein Com
VTDRHDPVTDAAELWCEHCNRLIRASDVVVDEDGYEHCPRCSALLDDASDETDEDDAAGAPKPPWHFKVLLIATVIYLIYRLIWFIFWLSHHA